jgi:hypothetical protein
LTSLESRPIVEVWGEYHHLKGASNMNELTRPFIRLWEYVGTHGGFPGQLFFVISVIMIAVALFTWISNRR